MTVQDEYCESNGAAVYVLDDDPTVLKAIDRLLRASGVAAKTFSDPHRFLEHAEQHRPRVAVVDILMPLMDGLEVQQRLRSIAPETRVIVLTSNDEPVVRAKAMRAGASGFFLKVANEEEFLAHVRTQLNGAHAS